MAPILPGLSDRPELMADVVRAARDAGATSIWTNVLYLRPGTREHFMENLGRDWPELVQRYERLYAGRAYLPKDQVEPVRREVAELRHRFAIDDPVRAPRPAGAVEQSRRIDRSAAVRLPARDRVAVSRSAPRARHGARASAGRPTQLGLDDLASGWRSEVKRALPRSGSAQAPGSVSGTR